MNTTSDTRKQTIQNLLVRLELWLAPVLIIVPLGVSVFFIWDWFTRGFSLGFSAYDGELFLGLLLLIGNLTFDVPLLKSVRTQRKKI